MPGCGCNNAVKIEKKKKIVGQQVLKKSGTTKCLNYGGYDSNVILFDDITINYSEIDRYQYYRIVPNYFRYFVPNGQTPFNENYEYEIEQNNDEGRCLRAQLEFGPIRLWSLEEMFIKLVPSKSDLPLIQLEKDNIRNQWIAFCLNIEKTFLYFYKGKLTCNNNNVPWLAYFNIQNQDTSNYTFLNASDVSFTNYDQTIMYKLSNSYFLNFLIGKKQNPFNYYNILRKALSLPIVGEETEINFYELIYITYFLLQDLFTISQTLLLGKDPGLPKQFIELYFPPIRQRYYYNFYLSMIETRNRNFGFGDRINTSNGSGTYIPVPGSIPGLPLIPP